MQKFHSETGKERMLEGKGGKNVNFVLKSKISHR